MGLLDSLQSILGGQNQASDGASQGNPLTGLLAPAALGGLMGALMTNKTARKMTGNVLLVGGGAALAGVLWNKYKNRAGQPQEQAQQPQTPSYQQTTYAPQQQPQQATYALRQPPQQPDQPYVQSSAFSQPSPFTQSAPATCDPIAKAKRLVKAMIFAAKSDGVIDGQEQQAVQETIHRLQLGQDAESLISQAMNEPLDPRAIAHGVSSQEEALEIYLISSSVIEVDHFMESSYLEALARELNIPPELTMEISQEIKRSKQQA